MKNEKHTVSALWVGIVSAWRRWFPLACGHEWVDGYVFANCIETKISGGSKPLSYQVMRFCEHCQATKRRLLTRAEWFAWREELLAAWEDGEGGIDFDWLEEAFPAKAIEARSDKTGTGLAEGESAAPQGFAQTQSGAD